ncbi:cytochrome p450 monooxygenase [Fusarium avenaceum]|nr:cytochrome p450 monooxygenase [Fusarium avenaceum]
MSFSASNTSVPWAWPDSINLDDLPWNIGLLPVTFLALVLVLSLGFFVPKSNLPLVNSPAWWELRWQKQVGFVKDGMKIIRAARKKYAGRPYRVITTVGECIVLPPAFVNSIRNNTALNFRKAITRDFHFDYPGFTPFALLDDPNLLLLTVVRKQLTKHLNTVTAPLASETAFATNHIFSNSLEWQDIQIQAATLDLVARLSSRVFLGDKICRNEAWLKITKEYTILVFTAAAKMNLVPALFRPLAMWLDPTCKQVRAALAGAHSIMAPMIEARRKLVADAQKSGQKVPVFNDAIEWAETEAKDPSYNAAVFQLTMSFAAIHTTTDLLTQTLIRLADKPEVITPLREEIVAVLKTEGWKKAALYNMKLLDSAIKEAQRLKPTETATKDVTLPDGFVVRKGEHTVVDTYSMSDPNVHSDPDKYDIYRFKKMREEPGGEHRAQLVSTSPDHLAFGHGYYACPGRFFASNEIKVALCYLLLRYDWKMAPGSTAEPICHATAMAINPETRLMFRRRKEEIDLEALAFE